MIDQKILKNSRILIVDDQADNIDVLESLLTFQGYGNLESTTDPRKTLELIRVFNPDLILLDLMMPHISGYEVLKLISAQNPPENFLPVLVLTADISSEARQHALEAGAKDFLSKPFDLAEVGLRIHNLLETRYLYNQLKEQNRILEETNKDLKAFDYSVSHDLRTPLRHISGFAKIILDEHMENLPETARRDLHVIEKSAKQLQVMLDALLDFSLRSRKNIILADTDMNRIITEVKEMLYRESGGRKITWDVKHLPVVMADTEMMRNVWFNLIGNAIKFTARKEEARISIGYTENNGETEIYISDNGIGFDMKYADKLFGVFNRLHSEKDFEGTGIGLANVSKIITRHGGRIRAESAPDQGATFYFTLPRA